MNKIHKYLIPISDKHTLTLPEDHKILSVQPQDGIITMWVFVNTQSPMTTRSILIYGTCHDLGNLKPDDYIATVQDTKGFVWHLFG